MVGIYFQILILVGNGIPELPVLILVWLLTTNSGIDKINTSINSGIFVQNSVILEPAAR